MNRDREEITFTTLGAAGGSEQHTYVIQVMLGPLELCWPIKIPDGMFLTPPSYALVTKLFDMDSFSSRASWRETASLVAKVGRGCGPLVERTPYDQDVQIPSGAGLFTRLFHYLFLISGSLNRSLKEVQH